MLKRCEGCGTALEAQKPNRKWCSDLCGKQTRRRRSSEASGPVMVAIQPAGDGELSLLGAVRAELEAAGMVGTSLGQLALLLAERLSGPGGSASGMAAVSRELGRVLALLRGATVAAPVDPLDELKKRRDAKRLAAP